MAMICFNLTRIAMNSPRIIMNFIYYPDGGHRTRIIIWKFVDNYMSIICFIINTNYRIIFAIQMEDTEQEKLYGKFVDNYMSIICLYSPHPDGFFHSVSGFSSAVS